MEKTWLWRKKSSEKITIVNDKVNLLFTDSGEEEFRTDKKDEVERSLKDLNQKLSSALSECNAKDELVTKHAKVAEEALAGWEKAEAEAMSFKQDLDEALRQKLFMEERMSHTDAALRECMQQLRFVREEQEQRVHDAVTKTSNQHQKVQINLEEKLTETSKRIAKLSVENTHLTNALHTKEKQLEDLTKRNAQLEVDFNALTSRCEAREKDDASLKYELCMVEKELEIRNEEREYNRRSAEASHKQQLENVKKIAKLENECQRLRVLVRKRLPGPAALAQMKNEVELLGREPVETMTRKTNHPMGGSMGKDFRQDKSIDSPSKKINYLIERLCAMEEENKALKEAMSKKNEEIQSSKVMYAHSVSKLSQVEAQLAELSKGPTSMELARNSPLSHILGLPSISKVDASEDSESWASALISELDHFRNEKPKGSPSCKTVGGSDISLMDDFVEMEKLAIVCIDKPFESPHVSPHGSNDFLGPLEVVSPSECTGKELVPVVDSPQELQPKNSSARKYPSWLQDILRIVLQENRATLRSVHEIVEDVRTALAHMKDPGPGDVINSWKRSNLSTPSKRQQISGFVSWKSPNDSPVSSKEPSNQQIQPSLSESICKLIELVEGVYQQSLTDCSGQQLFSENGETPLPNTKSATPSGYIVRVFQWKSSELSDVLWQFIHTCTDLLDGKVDLEKFTRELTSAFDWILNHCFLLRDVSNTKDTIKNHFDWDETRSESEHGAAVNSSYPEAEKAQTTNEETKMEFAKRGLEEKLKSETNKIEALVIQLQELGNSKADLQTEVESLRASKVVIEDEIKNHKLLIEGLNNQLTETRIALNGAHQKSSSLEVELKDRSNSCRELESTCLELQLQLESLAKKDTLKSETEQKERQFQNGWEITAASEKLAECQETILNLGKQLKAMASPRGAELLDKVISVTPSPATVSKKNRTSSLLDKMLADDDDSEGFKSPQMKEIICTTDPHKPPTHPSHNPYGTDARNEPLRTLEHCIGSAEKGYKKDYTPGGALAIVPSKKRGGGGGSFLRKLLLRRKKGSSKKLPLPMVA